MTEIMTGEDKQVKLVNQAMDDTPADETCKNDEFTSFATLWCHADKRSSLSLFQFVIII